MTDRELMQQVLEALEGWNHVLEPKPDAELISALRSRLAQPVQEPAAKAWDEGYRQGVEDECISAANIGIAGFGAKVKPARQNPYGITPPQRKPLTDEQIKDALVSVDAETKRLPSGFRDFARAIEAAHGIKGEA